MDTPSAILLFVFGVILGGIPIGAIVAKEEESRINHALSCMGDGNTILQCQEILGLTTH